MCSSWSAGLHTFKYHHLSGTFTLDDSFSAREKSLVCLQPSNNSVSFIVPMLTAHLLAVGLCSSLLAGLTDTEGSEI